jgi:hypothetical protein
MSKPEFDDAGDYAGLPVFFKRGLAAQRAGYQRDQLSAAIWRAVDAALSAGKESR